MAYNRNIPQPTDLISNSQSQLLGNFQAIDSGATGTGIGFSRNHVTMTDATNGGLHSRVDFYQSVASPTISGFISSAYPKAVSGVSELFYKNGTSDTQITSSSIAASSGQGFIPGGLQIRAGTAAWPGQSGAVTFSAAFPTACVSVVVSVANSGNLDTTINVLAFNTSQFTVFSPNALSPNLSYIAIGY